MYRKHICFIVIDQAGLNATQRIDPTIPHIDDDDNDVKIDAIQGLEDVDVDMENDDATMKEFRLDANYLFNASPVCEATVLKDESRPPPYKIEFGLVPSFDSVNQIIFYMYTGTIKPNAPFLEIMVLAHMWGMKHLYNIVKRAAIANLNTTNCLELMRLLATLNDKRMTRHVADFIRKCQFQPNTIDVNNYGSKADWILNAIICPTWTFYD